MEVNIGWWIIITWKNGNLPLQISCANYGDGLEKLRKIAVKHPDDLNNMEKIEIVEPDVVIKGQRHTITSLDSI